jgi:hypothetical protein
MSSGLNADLEEEDEEDDESQGKKSQFTFTSGVEYWPDDPTAEDTLPPE